MGFGFWVLGLVSVYSTSIREAGAYLNGLGRFEHTLHEAEKEVPKPETLTLNPGPSAVRWASAEAVADRSLSTAFALGAD